MCTVSTKSDRLTLNTMNMFPCTLFLLLLLQSVHESWLLGEKFRYIDVLILTSLQNLHLNIRKTQKIFYEHVKVGMVKCSLKLVDYSPLNKSWPHTGPCGKISFNLAETRMEKYHDEASISVLKMFNLNVTFTKFNLSNSVRGCFLQSLNFR